MNISVAIFLALGLGMVVEGQEGAGTCFQRIRGPPRKVKWSVCKSKGKYSLLEIFNYFVAILHTPFCHY